MSTVIKAKIHLAGQMKAFATYSAILAPLLGWLLITSGPALAKSKSSSPIINTDNGQLAGVVHGETNVYWNIPYAVAERWQPPKQVGNWSGVRAETQAGPICPQKSGPNLPQSLIQSEDCLNLNVWVPQGKRDKPLPVMVWIHGGGFRMGSGSLPKYNGNQIVARDVILVTINYRLGLLGRFAHPELSKEQAGQPRANYGLMDQVAALQWVNRNIANFGGDPHNVTIFGQSAGGVSVNYLMATPSARNLFHKAISQSGGIQVEMTPHISVTKPGMLGKPLEDQGIATAEYFGNAGAPMALADLRKLPPEKLVDYQEKSLIGSLNPVVDGILVPEEIGRTFRDGQQARVPYMAGSTNWEASLLHNLPVSVPPRAILAGIDDLDRARAAFDVASDEEMADAWFADSVFLGTAHYLTNASAYIRHPSWLYYFDHVSKAIRDKVPGAAHGDEVPYIFGTLPADISGLSADQVDDEDRRVSSLMTSYWTNFAKTGDPNGAGIPKLSARKVGGNAMNIINQSPRVDDNFLKNRMTFLDQYYEEHMLAISK